MGTFPGEQGGTSRGLRHGPLRNFAPMPTGSTSGVAVRIEHGRERDISAVTKATWAGFEGRDTAHTAEAEGPSERHHRPHLTHRQWGGVAGPGRSGSAPGSPKSPSSTVRSRSPGSGKAAQRRRRGGSDAPAGRCRRRRGRPHPPLRRQAHTGHRTDRARNCRRPAARVMGPRTPPAAGPPCGHGGQRPSDMVEMAHRSGPVARPAAGPAQRGPHSAPPGAAARRNVSDTDQRGPAADHRGQPPQDRPRRPCACGNTPTSA